MGTWKILHPGVSWASQSRDWMRLPASSPRFGNDDAGPAEIQLVSGRDLSQFISEGFGRALPSGRCWERQRRLGGAPDAVGTVEPPIAGLLVPLAQGGDAAGMAKYP